MFALNPIWALGGPPGRSKAPSSQWGITGSASGMGDFVGRLLLHAKVWNRDPAKPNFSLFFFLCLLSFLPSSFQQKQKQKQPFLFHPCETAAYAAAAAAAPSLVDQSVCLPVYLYDWACLSLSLSLVCQCSASSSVFSSSSSSSSNLPDFLCLSAWQ